VRNRSTKKRPVTPKDLDSAFRASSGNKLAFKRNTAHGSMRTTAGTYTSNRKDLAAGSLRKDKLVVTNATQVAKPYTDVEEFDDFVAYSRWNAVRPNEIVSPAHPRPTIAVEGGESQSRRSGNMSSYHYEHLAGSSREMLGRREPNVMPPPQQRSSQYVETQPNDR
jgi:hypothetical protein